MFMENSINKMQGESVEEEVYKIIQSVCESEEKIEIQKQEKHSIRLRGRYIPDIYLPNGCKALDFPAKTIIEIKNRLQTDTLFRLKKLYEEFIETNRDSEYTFVVIYKQSNNFPLKLIEDLKKGKEENKFRICSLDELEEKKENANSVEINKNINSEELPSCIDEAYKVFSKGPNTLFLGAGVSMSAGLPSWKKLLEGLLDIAHKNGKVFDHSYYGDLFEQCGFSSIIMGRLVQNLFDNDKDKMDRAIREVFYQDRTNISSFAIDVICEIIAERKELVQGVITYNYDDLIEQGLDRRKVNNYSVCENNEPDIAFPICHVHGLLPQKALIPSTIVLSEKEYHDIYRRSFHWSNVEQLHALQRTNCFFIGLSMTDPNLRRLLDIAQGEHEKRSLEMRHFAFLDKKSIGFFKSDKEKEEYIKLQESIFRDLGVGIIWYDNYENLPKELMKLIS